MRKVILNAILLLTLSVSMLMCKKKCVMPENTTFSFAQVTWANVSYDSENCRQICDNSTSNYIPNAGLSICGIEKFGCDYNNKINTIIIKDSDGYETYYTYKDGLPDRYKTMECCLIYKDIKESNTTIYNDFSFDKDTYKTIEPSVYEVTPKGTVEAEQGKTDDKSFIKFVMPKVIENYSEGLFYEGLPSKVYNLRELVKPTLNKNNIQKVWTNDKNLILDSEGAIVLSESEDTPLGSLNYIYFQLEGDNTTYRTALIIKRSSEKLLEDPDQRAKYYFDNINDHLDDKPCFGGGIQDPGTAGPPNMIVPGP